MYINYIRESEAFITDASDKNLCSNARLLWYALFHIMNQRANGGVWPDGLISINNKTLLSFVPFSEDALVKARNQLAQHGFIRYKSGERRSANPQYAILCVNERRGIPGDDEQEELMNRAFYPANTGKKDSKTDGKTTGKISGKTDGKTVYQYPNININEDETESSEEEEENEEEQLACARAEAERAWRGCFGKAATPSVINALSWRSVMLRFDAGVLTRAIETAALKGASSPSDYIFKLLQDWHYNRVKTVQDADEYAFVYDAAKGKISGMNVSDGLDRLRQFRERNEKQE